MNMNLRQLIIGAVTGLFLGTTAMSFGQLTDLQSSQDGRGTLNYRTRSSNTSVSRAAVNLRRDGQAEISVRVGANETFSGRWRNDGNRRCRIDIEEVGRDDARGTGWVEHDGRGNFTRIELEGTVGSTRFTLSFSADRNQGGHGPEINSTRNGRGTLNYRTRSSNSNVNRLTVWLRQNNEFEIRPVGNQDSFRGRWWNDGRNVIRLDIDRISGDSATGTGTVNLDGRGSFDRVNLSGRTGNSRFDLDFTSRDDGSGNDTWDRDEIRFLEEAKKAVRKKFSRPTDFEWSRESVGKVVFGQRTVTGEVRARGGNNPGYYKFRVVLGAGTKDVKSVNLDRQ